MSPVGFLVYLYLFFALGLFFGSRRALTSGPIFDNLDVLRRVSAKGSALWGLVHVGHTAAEDGVTRGKPVSDERKAKVVMMKCEVWRV